MAGRSNTPKNVPQNDTVHPIEEIRLYNFPIEEINVRERVFRVSGVVKPLFSPKKKIREFFSFFFHEQK
jgi:hypothetical protein